MQAAKKSSVLFTFVIHEHDRVRLSCVWSNLGWTSIYRFIQQFQVISEFVSVRVSFLESAYLHICSRIFWRSDFSFFPLYRSLSGEISCRKRSILYFRATLGDLHELMVHPGSNLHKTPCLFQIGFLLQNLRRMNYPFANSSDIKGQMLRNLIINSLKERKSTQKQLT